MPLTSKEGICLTCGADRNTVRCPDCLSFRKPDAPSDNVSGAPTVSETDWIGAKSEDCVCHRGKGWVCPIHGDVEAAQRKLVEVLSETSTRKEGDATCNRPVDSIQTPNTISPVNATSAGNAAPVVQPNSDAAHLGNLLAVIHGGGGHYQSEHGDQKAVADAIQKISDMRVALDASPSPSQVTQGRWTGGEVYAWITCAPDFWDMRRICDDLAVRHNASLKDDKKEVERCPYIHCGAEQIRSLRQCMSCGKTWEE